MPQSEAAVVPPPSSTRQSLVSGGTYAIANASQRALAFLLLPVYTTVLTTAEYGRLGVLITIQSGAAMAFAMGMDQAALRQYFQLEGDRRAQERFVVSSWNFLILAAAALAIVVALAIVAFVPESPVFRPAEAALAVLSAATFVGATVVPLTLLRAEHRRRDYLVMTAVTGVSTTVLTVLLVVVLDLGVGGWFAAVFMSNAITLVAALRILPWHRVDRFDRENVGASLRLGLPLVPHAASHWALQLADRLVLSGIVTASALGVYTLAANLALPALVLVQSLNQGFMPSYARRRNAPGATAELRQTITIQLLLVLLVGCAMAVLAPAVADLLSPSYAGAAELIPWMVLGFIFLGFYYVPMNVISLMAGRTAFIWVLTLTSALTNVAIIVTFAPDHGIKAAAVAVACGYLVLLILTSAYARYLKLGLSIEWRRIITMSAVAAVTFVVGAVLLPADGVLPVLARLLVLATLPVTMTLAAGYPPAEALAKVRSALPGRR